MPASLPGLTGVGRAANMPELAVDVAAFGMHSVHHFSPCVHLLLCVDSRRMRKPAFIHVPSHYLRCAQSIVTNSILTCFIAGHALPWWNIPPSSYVVNSELTCITDLARKLVLSTGALPFHSGLACIDYTAPTIPLQIVREEFFFTQFDDTAFQLSHSMILHNSLRMAELISLESTLYNFQSTYEIFTFITFTKGARELH